MNKLLNLTISKIGFLKSEGFKKGLLYLAGIIISFGSLSLITRRIARYDLIDQLTLLLGGVLLIGILHVILLRKVLEDHFPVWMEIFICLAGNLLGVVLFIQFNTLPLNKAAGSLYLFSLLFFSFPFFIVLAFNAMTNIPKLSFTPVSFEQLKDIVGKYDFGEDQSKGVIWTFENFQSNDESGPYWVRTHVPYHTDKIALKDLFKGLLSLHNHNLSPEHPIPMENESGLIGWRFFYQSNFMGWKTKRPLNPNKSLKANGVPFKKLNKAERLEGVRKGLPAKFSNCQLWIEGV